MKKTLLFLLFFSYGFSQNPDLNLNNYKFIVVDEMVGNMKKVKSNEAVSKYCTKHLNKVQTWDIKI